MSKTVLFQTIQFSTSTQFSSIRPIDRTLPGATTQGQSVPGSNGNEGVLRIPQSSSIIETLPSDCLVPYTWTLVWEGVLYVCSVFYSPSQLGKWRVEMYLIFSFWMNYIFLINFKLNYPTETQCDGGLLYNNFKRHFEIKGFPCSVLWYWLY